MNYRKLSDVSEFLKYVRRSGYFLRVLYLGLILLIILFVWFVFRMGQVRSEAERDLQVISSLKITQLLQWKNERLSEASFITSNQLVKDYLVSCSGSCDSVSRKKLLAFASPFLNKWRYSGIFLLGPDSALFSATGEHAGYDDSLKTRVSDLSRGKRTLCMGFFKNTDLGKTCFDIYAPVTDNKGRVMAVLLLRSDPWEYLFPLVRSWPTKSKTSENMLVQLCGDSVQVICSTMLPGRSALELMIPMSHKTDVAVRVLNGSRGMTGGRDYLNKRVFAFVTPLEDTPWFFVSKVNMTELVEQLTPEMLLLLLTIIFLMILISLFRFLSVRTREMIGYRELAEAREKQRSALAEQARLIAEKEQIKSGLLGKLNEAQEVARIGSWESDFVKGTDWWSDEMFSLLGSDHDLYKPGLATIEVLVYLEDLDLFHEKVIRSFYNSEPFDVDFRINTTGGELRYFNMKGRPYLSDSSVSKGMIGTLMDITPRKTKEDEVIIVNESLQVLVDAIGKLTESRSLDHLASVVTYYAGRLTGSGYIRFLVRDGDFMLVKGEDLKMTSADDLKFELGTDAISKALLSSETTFAGNIRNERLAPCLCIPGYSESSLLIVPVKSERTSGAFTICRPGTRAPDEMQIKVLESLSYAAAISLENLRFYTELEMRVNERTELLQAVNRELESFSYSVSHDLRAPLRSIESFVRILGEDYSAQLGEEGARICGLIAGSSRKMRSLIDNLLDFARLGKQELNSTAINMKELAESVVADLISGAETENTYISIEDIPDASGDPFLLRQVWVNYLSNALKFTSAKESRRISVAGQREDDRLVYAVADNGAGFNMEYSGKLFGVFQRLHSSREFEGTGVGLAIVKRIIHRHGGTVWAEGKTGEGAKFFFALPLNQQPVV